MSWRLVEFPVESYPDQAAFVTQAIFDARLNEEIPNTVVQYLHQKDGIMMGRQLDPDLDVNFERAREKGIPVKRSLTPGIALGNPGLVFTAVYVDAETAGSRTAQEILDTYMSRMAESYSNSFGIDITYEPRNDFNYGDKKIGLGGCYMEDGYAQFRTAIQTTPLEHELMSEILTPPEEKYSDKDRETTVKTRSTCLQKALDEDVSPMDVRDASIRAVESAFDIDLTREGLTMPEFRNVVEYREQYDTDVWLWGNSIYRTFGTDFTSEQEVLSNITKIPSGPTIRARLLLNTNTNELDGVSITGYFHGLSPIDVIDRLEAELSGASFTEADLRDHLDGFFSEDRYISKLSTDDLLDILLNAEPVEEPLPESPENPYATKDSGQNSLPQWTDG